MSRFYDKLRELKAINEDMPVIKCDNVVEYIEQLPKPLKTDCGDAREFDPVSYPCVIPPFTRCFMESKLKDKKYFGVEIITMDNMGIMDIWFESFGDIMLLSLNNVWRWNETGKLISDVLANIKHDGKNIIEITEVVPTMPDFEKIYDMIAIAVYTAISLMHCKNVTIIKHEPPFNVQKKRVKNKKLPLTKYYTLDIEPMKKVLKTEGGIDEVGLQRALHICRGHFKDYRDGKGLFGKHKGLYWWDSTVKGNANNGEIKKDYALKMLNNKE